MAMQKLITPGSSARPELPTEPVKTPPEDLASMMSRVEAQGPELSPALETLAAKIIAERRKAQRRS